MRGYFVYCYVKSFDFGILGRINYMVIRMLQPPGCSCPLTGKLTSSARVYGYVVNGV